MFGPVPSRRLGRSLGVNNVPYKTCSYSCIYCQLGETTELTVRRKGFYDPLEVAMEVEQALSMNAEVDYVTLVPDGEPTLDINLGKLVRLLKERTRAPLAVLTNSSLLWMMEVREALEDADLVSLKLDAVEEDTWRSVNRPHPSLDLNQVLEGLSDFARGFKGRLLVEAMLVKGVNDRAEELRGLAGFISKLRPFKVYIAVPTRPPALPWVEPAGEEDLVTAHQFMASELSSDRVELLVEPEGVEVGVVGDAVDALLRTSSVHPLRVEQAFKMLEGVVESPEACLRQLTEAGLIKEVKYRGASFLIRGRLKKWGGSRSASPT